MKSIAYFLYGGKPEYQLELTYSVLSAAHFLTKTPADIRLVVITDEENRRPDLPVEHLIFDAAQLADWTPNGYRHQAKVHALRMALDHFQDAVALVDTDTFFLKHPGTLFDRVDGGNAVMHARDGFLREHPSWRPILERVPEDIAGCAISGDTEMFNSGVIGLDFSQRALLEDVLVLIDELYAISPLFNIEQLAVSAVLEKHVVVNLCPDTVSHYWGYQRHFIRAQIAALFPAFSRELFESYVTELPAVGMPRKARRDQIRARLKDLQRRLGSDYRFAFLAYLSAFSARDTSIADAWANVALDMLEVTQIRSPHVATDFRQFTVPRLNAHGWLSADTRRRWIAYWEKSAT